MAVRVRWMARLVTLSALGLGPIAFSAQEKDDATAKLAKRVAKIDKTFYKALADLAVSYDKEEDPEAASWFAECAVGFGSTDEKIKEIKTQREVKAYLGKIQDKAGKPLEKTFPIRSKLDGPTGDYKKFIQELERKWHRWKHKIDTVEVTDGEQKIAKEVAVKYEFAARAHEYIRCVKRINALRREMRLRPVLWDFEVSQKLIVPCATCQDGNGSRIGEAAKRSIYYDPDLNKFADEHGGIGAADIGTWGEEVRDNGHGRP